MPNCSPFFFFTNNCRDARYKTTTTTVTAGKSTPGSGVTEGKGGPGVLGGGGGVGGEEAE